MIAFANAVDLTFGATQVRNIRIAVVSLSGEQDRAQSNALFKSLEQVPGATMVDRSLTDYAATGVGYNGSINMNKNEARALGAAIGCEFFIIGKVQVLARNTTLDQTHWEALIAVMLVDARSGSLSHFDIVVKTGATEKLALGAATVVLEERAREYVERAAAIAGSRLTTRHPGPAEAAIEDMPEEGSRQAQGFTPPQFLNRVKPQYTDEADLAGITATVEAMAVFQSDGKIGDVEIVRWAGFGLDESAIAAIRHLKFTPALRDGRAISVRALIQYNFKTVAEPVPRRSLD